LKLRGSERTDTTSSPPRGTPDFETPVVDATDAVFERHAATASAQIAVSAAKNSCRRTCLFEI
jgi:hypothetical protein